MELERAAFLEVQAKSEAHAFPRTPGWQYFAAFGSPDCKSPRRSAKPCSSGSASSRTGLPLQRCLHLARNVSQF